MNTPNTGHDIIINEYNDLVTRLSGKAMIRIILVIITEIFLYFKERTVFNGLFFFIMAILAAVGLVVFTRTFSRDLAAGQIKRSWKGMVGSFGGILPYLFACYLIFFESVWRFVLLYYKNFSNFELFIGLFFFFMGYSLLRVIYRLSELASKISSMGFGS